MIIKCQISINPDKTISPGGQDICIMWLFFPESYADFPCFSNCNSTFPEIWIYGWYNATGSFCTGDITYGKSSPNEHNNQQAANTLSR